jgi:hypothetical protein
MPPLNPPRCAALAGGKSAPSPATAGRGGGLGWGPKETSQRRPPAIPPAALRVQGGSPLPPLRPQGAGEGWGGGLSAPPVR